MNKYAFLVLCMIIGCGSVAIDPKADSSSAAGSGDAVSSSGGFGGMQSSSASGSGAASAGVGFSSSSGSGGCDPGWPIPGTDGGPDGSPSLCCSPEENQCNLLCCESVTYLPDGTPESGMNCKTNPELGLCCPSTFVCLAKP